MCICMRRACFCFNSHYYLVVQNPSSRREERRVSRSACARVQNVCCAHTRRSIPSSLVFSFQLFNLPPRDLCTCRSSPIWLGHRSFTRQPDCHRSLQAAGQFHSGQRSVALETRWNSFFKTKKNFFLFPFHPPFHLLPPHNRPTLQQKYLERRR